MKLHKKLRAFKESRSLVTIKRQNIDRNKIQGFLLDFSDELILIQYVYDFNLDGFMALRISDITSIESTKTDIFQTQLLDDEGLLSNIDFETSYNIKNWATLINNLSPEFRFLILEDENPEYPLFFLGEISKIAKDGVSIRGFSGAANWDDELSEISFKDISSLQAGNNYAQVYERYFSKQ